MRELTLRLQAQLDAHDAAGWYEDQRFGLGMRFLDELDEVVNRIRVSPFQFPEIHPGVRRGLLGRFPYSVYFSVGEESIEVIAVLHQHRHPDTWRDGL
jgi:toxin ParE1/3/4